MRKFALDRTATFHFPLERIHSFALDAAEAAECAGRQGRFWEMRDRLFSNDQSLEYRSLLNSAQILKLDVSEFTQCLEGDQAFRRPIH